MPKNNQQYWADRLNEIAQHRFDTTNDAIQKELKSMYDEVANKMQAEVEALYYKMLDDELKRSEIWTYKHYRDLEKQINREMVKLGNKEVKLLNSNLEIALQEIYKDTGIVPGADKFALLSPAMVKAIVNRPWSAQHFTSTCWKNKEALAQQLKKGVAESIITGKSKDKLVEAVMQKTGAGFNNADRVVRTELMHTINQGQIQRYKDTGYTKLVWNCGFDARTCDDCANNDGMVIDINSLDVPPMHPRCRCTVCPVIESLKLAEKDVQNTAKNKRGEEIKYSLDGMKEENKNKVIETITRLSNEYNTELREVTRGIGNEAGSVNIGFIMKLGSTKEDAIYHEFAHTLAMTDADKYKLTDNKEFWKEIKKVRKEYEKAISNSETIPISAYASDSVDEFMAESFMHAKLKGYKELNAWYGDDYKYSEKVLSIIDKYFKK